MEGIEVLPLTAERWADFEVLFGPRGACGGCWCMTPRLSRRQYEEQKGEGNRRAMKQLVDSGRVPGLLAYREGRAVGWISVEPRERIEGLRRSRVAAPLDDRPVWSIVCLFVDREFRGRGLSVALIEGAARWVASQGGDCLEGYPVEPRKKPMPPVFAYTGLASAYLRAGFREIARRSPTRPLMRREV